VLAEIDPVVAWELGRVAKLNVLADGEILCEVEDALVGDSLGALLVTDLRVLFATTGVFRRRTRLVSIPLETVHEAEALDTANVFKRGKWGLLVLLARGRQGDERHEFDAISGRPRQSARDRRHDPPPTRPSQKGRGFTFERRLDRSQEISGSP